MKNRNHNYRKTLKEMETAALYMNASRSGKRALGIFTVSDEIFTGAELTSDERQSTLDQMIRISLDTASAI